MNTEKQLTAVKWLNEMLRDNHKEVFDGNIWEQAKAMERQQIKDAQMDMFNNTNQNKFGLDYLNKRDAAEEYAGQYYNETFKSE